MKNIKIKLSHNISRNALIKLLRLPINHGHTLIAFIIAGTIAVRGSHTEG